MSVEIIIPVYRRAEIAEITLREVLATTDAPVILIDDCDFEPDTAEFMARASLMAGTRIRTLRMAQNSGWIGATKAAASISQADWLLFLNSDCIPTAPGWVEKMTAQPPAVGIVGALLLYPPGHIHSGLIQHAGVAATPEGQPYHILALQDPSAARTLDCNAVTGACFAIRRECWNELEGWAPEFGRGVYEDIDLCWRARNSGWGVRFQADVVMHHHESASREPNGSHKLHDHWQKNLFVLMRKHTVSSDEAIFIDAVTMARWNAAREHLRASLEVAPDLPFAYRTIGMAVREAIAESRR